MQRTILGALLLVFGVALGACGADGQGSGVEQQRSNTSPASASRSPSPAETVELWVKAIRQGDTDAAWALTHSASREAIGGRAAFDDDAPALAEGYGAWADSSDVRYTTVSASVASDQHTIVLLRGTIAEEGPPEQRADAVPVRSEGGRHLVDPFHDLTVPEAGFEIHPAPNSAITSGTTFEVYLAGGREVALLVGDRQIPTESESTDGDQQRVAGTPGTLSQGSLTLTIVVVREGLIQARSVTYTVR